MSSESPKVCLLTLWVGNPPEWHSEFVDRIEANHCLDWKLLTYESVEEVNSLVYKRLGMICNKNSEHSLCDLRPLLGSLYRRELEGYDWWGWVDLDVVLGNLDKLLPLRLSQHYDIITTDPNIINGPLTLLRNSPQSTEMWMEEDRNVILSVLSNPNYCNYDEAGYSTTEQVKYGRLNDNPSFTKLVKRLEGGKLYVYWGDQCWEEGSLFLPYEYAGRGDIPARCCQLNGKDLIEVPTGRELMLYHFTALPKQWPLPNRYSKYASCQQSYIVQKMQQQTVFNAFSSDADVSFWSDRVTRTVKDGKPIYLTSYNTSQEDWHKIQQHTTSVLSKEVRKGASLLDVGCGYGALFECLKEADLQVVYHGIDFCPDMIELAKMLATYGNTAARYQHAKPVFEVMDARTPLPFLDCSFDVAICRGLEGSIITSIGSSTWDRVEQELLRISSLVILINLKCEYRIAKRY